jgi:hypothetical protein
MVGAWVADLAIRSQYQILSRADEKQFGFTVGHRVSPPFHVGSVIRGTSLASDSVAILSVIRTGRVDQIRCRTDEHNV